jgi:hypothetical protein
VVAETATGTDVDAAAVAFLAAITELATGTDSITTRFLWEIIDDEQTANWGNVTNTQTAGWQNVNDTQTTNWQNITNTQSPGWAQVSDTQTPAWTDVSTI